MLSYKTTEFVISILLPEAREIEIRYINTMEQSSCEIDTH